MDVRDVMTQDAVSVGPATPLKDVARVLVERRISGLPVVNEQGAVVGVVSEGDFLLKEAGGGVNHRRFLSRLRGGEPDPGIAIATTAGELMTAPAITIEAGQPLASAAAVMSRRKVNRLPVVEQGRLVGIITRADIVRAYVRSDADLEKAVRSAIHAVDGLRLVRVKDGVAVLSGTVADRSLAGSVRDLVARIDGLVAVDDADVAWIERDEAMEEARWHGDREDLVSG